MPEIKLYISFILFSVVFFYLLLLFPEQIRDPFMSGFMGIWALMSPWDLHRLRMHSYWLRLYVFVSRPPGSARPDPDADPNPFPKLVYVAHVFFLQVYLTIIYGLKQMEKAPDFFTGVTTTYTKILTNSYIFFQAPIIIYLFITFFASYFTRCNRHAVPLFEYGTFIADGLRIPVLFFTFQVRLAFLLYAIAVICRLYNFDGSVLFFFWDLFIQICSTFDEQTFGHARVAPGGFSDSARRLKARYWFYKFDVFATFFFGQFVGFTVESHALSLWRLFATIFILSLALFDYIFYNPFKVIFLCLDI